ncbi:EAL domain-containing protein [Stappia sp. BW2]|uniref:putative bifunctional diguanylate cyclase/phosphodiesterase n=1 Tax=Stappia sp. BW2 TaxID=2592622 RepID=UPI0011DE8AB3|nr:EAL domain-containing protein [Stappia sp. BW2]TYC64589.1 EAL domain-containing protein [Stappia sp. BW2]
MSEILGGVTGQQLLFVLGIASALVAVGYFFGRRRGLAAVPARVSGFGNDTAILQLVVQHAHEGLVMQDIYGRIEWTNPAYSRITGFSAEEIRGRRPQEFILPPANQISAEEIETFRFDLTKFRSGTEELILNRRKDGKFFWNQLTFAVVEGKTLEDTKIILICRDVTNQVEHVKDLEHARIRLKHQAEHDDLTGVANRGKLNSYLLERIAEGVGGNARIGIIHFDLDHFKDINDSHGHGAGDTVLRHVATVMSRVLGNKGLVARIGGDEFVAVVSDPQGREEMEDLGNRIIEGLTKPVRVDRHQVRVTGSVGLVLADAATASASELMNHADIALYAAKRSGRSQICWYTDALGAAHRHRRMILAQLDEDLENSGLSLMLIPQYDMESRRITGYEAAACWLHPSEGLVDPVSLLSAQDDTKRIAQIELFALREGLNKVRRLRDVSKVAFFMSVNLSGASLKDAGFVAQLRQAAWEAGFETSDIVVELDEKIIRFDEQDGLSGSVDLLKEIGCRVALDKFGGGHGGAGQLIYLNADRLKLCPMLVAGLEECREKQQLIQSIIRLAGNMGLTISAAGVDTATQADLLRQFGCTMVQGKIIAEPLSVTEAEIHMREFEFQEHRA